MNTLFIDSHSEIITVALRKEGKVYKEEKESHYEHGVFLMNMVKDIIENNGLTTKDINEIVAINGPGSFTGLRIGLTIAKTMAYSLNIPVYLVGSLESYLVSNEIAKDKMSVIEDNKGYYYMVMDKDNNVLINETYIENIDDLNYEKVPNQLDINKVLDYALKKEATPAHLVRANYVKKIEVEK